MSDWLHQLFTDWISTGLWWVKDESSMATQWLCWTVGVQGPLGDKFRYCWACWHGDYSPLSGGSSSSGWGSLRKRGQLIVFQYIITCWDAKRDAGLTICPHASPSTLFTLWTQASGKDLAMFKWEKRWSSQKDLLYVMYWHPTEGNWSCVVKELDMITTGCLHFSCIKLNSLKLPIDPDALCTEYCLTLNAQTSEWQKTEISMDRNTLLWYL